jgi:serine/threonine protein kinase
MPQNQDLVDIIDPSLGFKQNLMKYNDRPVYQVERDGALYVLKIFDNNDDWQRQHIEHEKMVLIGAKKISGITHLVHDYGVIGGYNAILKEFAEGEDLSQLGGKLTNPILKSHLEENVNELHKMGVAQLELHPKNIVIGPNERSAKIVDLGYCRFKNEVSEDLFDAYMVFDLYSIDKLSNPGLKYLKWEREFLAPQIKDQA